ncbi:hypothetical protein [Mesobacillus zeae]|uniref:Uncharacterized protein n=1 Tax=Mesobacillus zeae TaxID=1917180 RepID=A0A398BDQ8_9BACI|nr:hypothetical protein [Mesobacillus zeae]RID85880.1 hypothetical protein D1970_10175 [Mesobacillus zeae]
MDYNTRISRLEAAIRSLSSAQRVELSCLAPVSASSWNNSISQEAYDSLLSSLDRFLTDYNRQHSSTLRELRSQLIVVQNQKQAEYNGHYTNLRSLPAEERKMYLSRVTMDPSVRSMVSWMA